MPWEDRLREAAYTSPSGVRHVFQYESVARETDKRTTAFEFPGVDESYVQDNGHGSRRYPLTCFFWGDDHDIEATAFEAGLLEAGVGRLEHPFYGTFDVVPFGTISRRDDLARSANQSVVQVTFWTTTGAVYPRLSIDAQQEILASLAALDQSVAAQFEDSADLSSTITQVNALAAFRSHIQAVETHLAEIAAVTSDINRAYRDAQSALNFGLDVLVGQPLQLALQVANLVTLPARAAAGILARLDAYEDLASDIFSSAAGSPTVALEGGTALPRRLVRVANDFFASDIFAVEAVAGAIRSTVETDFDSRPAAIAAADRVLTLFDDVVEWREAGFDATLEVDTGAAYQALHEAASLTAGYLIEVSFSLVPERSIVLDRPRTIIDLAAELYGSVDDRLDLLIQSNELSGSEILEVPAGRTIVYYA